MKQFEDCLRLSASDLANHLACRHLTSLDRGAARGDFDPPRWRDPAQIVLQERGFAHERAYVEHLRGLGLSIVPIEGDGNGGASAFDRVREAMRSGTDVIVQANLRNDRWHGRADILRRVERDSDIGSWSYEVIDTKLARETRAGTILQLCLYSDIVREVQGILPESTYVVSPGRGFEPEKFRLHDFFAYYRQVKQRLERVVDTSPVGFTYPDPVQQCDICRWWPTCDRRRRDDDHLCLVAGISKLQTREIQQWGVSSLADLSRLTLPLPYRARRGAQDSYVRVREQARVQLEGRTRHIPVHELLPREPGRGFACLPAPSRLDVFFDIEGDPFVGEGGLEYLFGWVVADAAGKPEYHGLWSLRPGEERVAFETFVDRVLALWEQDPGLHLYHYTPYDPGALKRLMGRYSTRESEIDRMLRAGLFVDLYAVVKQSLRASVEKYSIKDLEAFFGFERATPLRDAAAHKRALERTLELDRDAVTSAETLAVVEAYNRDDCVSALGLRDWLEQLRMACVARGEAIPRPVAEDPDPGEELSERTKRTQVLAANLMRGVPIDAATKTPDQRAFWLLAQLLEWHRREDKAPWWEFYRLRDLTEEELLDEKAALGRLEFIERVGGTDRCPVQRYRFPRQEVGIRAGDELRVPDPSIGIESFGSVEAIDPVERTVDIKKTTASAGVHASAVFEHSVVSTKDLFESLFRLGEWVLQNGIDGSGPLRAARDLLLALPPRLNEGGPGLQRPDEDSLVAARRLVLALDGGVLPIQGPPGAGKTYTGARMILDLVRAGRKVGVTAVSHKVIRNLLEKVLEAATDEGIPVRCAQKVKEKTDHPSIREMKKNDEIETALARSEVDVVGATAWLWARASMFESVDVLFVDEAGQISLANALAVAPAARNLVLLGDPRQLEQPQKGSHPEGTGISALEHLIAGHQTIPENRGLFLPVTWRLPPAICDFTKEIFYENRLHSRSGLDRQALVGDTPFAGAGLWWVPVEHEGNQSSSPEEVEKVAEVVASLVRPGVAWIDDENRRQSLTLEDILIVAPYNAQVADLELRLPGARVGTVDKFQGQEAAVVIYSLTTSSPEDAPRGMEFLYSSNRFNVATSRARCACILVANPRLFEPECRTPRQMQLANAFCRYLEMARTV